MYVCDGEIEKVKAYFACFNRISNRKGMQRSAKGQEVDGKKGSREIEQQE